LWAANEKGDAEFQCGIADLLLQIPQEPLRNLLPAATSWLQRRRDVLTAANRDGTSRFLLLWDRFARCTYVAAPDEVVEPLDDDLMTESLNSPGGSLAWTLMEALGAGSPQLGSGLPDHLRPCFDMIAAASGLPGLLARIYVVRELAYLDAIDSAWTSANLTGRLSWEHSEALPLWRSYAHGRVGSPKLFNSLKSQVLSAFERQRLSDDEHEGLISRLLSVFISHRLGEAAEYLFTPAEMKGALTVGPSAVRRNVAWNLWRMMGEADGDPIDKQARWREVIGPLFREIWPLDANLRDEETSRNLVLMALECEGAFPEAVEAIRDFLLPLPTLPNCSLPPARRST
jgi:hypothetical protein